MYLLMGGKAALMQSIQYTAEGQNVNKSGWLIICNGMDRTIEVTIHAVINTIYAEDQHVNMSGWLINGMDLTIEVTIHAVNNRFMLFLSQCQCCLYWCHLVVSPCTFRLQCHVCI